MSEAPDKDQKTEEPTEKKLEDARKRGEVAQAPETKHAAMFLAALLVVGWVGSMTMHRLGRVLAHLWANAHDHPITPEGAQNFVTGFVGGVGSAIAPLFGLLFVFALLGGLLQGRPGFAWTRLKPKWSKFNPITGFGRLLGPRALVEFAKTLAKLIVVVAVAFLIVWPKASGIDRLVGASPAAIGAAATDLVFEMLLAVTVLVFALALFDIVYQRHSFRKRMRMSLQEVKDEHKQTEGDPKIKAKVRSLQMQRAKNRMMTKVPEATVIITNPTHFAVALKYDHGAMAAPVVVAKGVDAIALKIREIATENRVPIVENVPLASALYASADLDRPIPTEHYAAVAEVISYVLRLARERMAG